MGALNNIQMLILKTNIENFVFCILFAKKENKKNELS